MTNAQLRITVLVILSAISLFWMSANLWETLSWPVSFAQKDPDSLLFARLLEQSILKGELVTEDSYGCFPYEIKLRFPPFYLRLLYHMTLSYYVLFPGSLLDPMIFAGLLPIAFTWFCGVLILFVVGRMSKSNTLFLLCCFFMLPGSAVSYSSGFAKLDYDFLNSFLIWLWIVSYLMFTGGASRVWLVVGSLATTLFLGTWSGAPFFYFFATLYAFGAWSSSQKDVDEILTYSASTMIIGGTVNLLMLSPQFTSGELFSLSSYSCFQPACVLVAGFFCQFLRELHTRKKPIWYGILLLAVFTVFVGAVFHKQLVEATGILFKLDPIHIHIGELKPIVKPLMLLKNNDHLSDLISIFGWPIFLFPLFAFLPWRWCSIGRARFLKYWLCLMIALSCYQVRYLRWMSVGAGLYYGVAFYLLWQMLRKQLSSAKNSSVTILMILLPMMVLQSIHNYNWMKKRQAISHDKVELFSWIRQNTPETSGYTDNSRPEYAILAPWGEGNAIGFYSRRPTVVNNAMWGYKTMADIFSSKTEVESVRLCEKYGVKYIMIPTSKKDFDLSQYGFWSIFRQMPEQPEYRLKTDKVWYDPDYQSFFYFWLLETLAMAPGTSFDASSHFRLVYVARSAEGFIAPYLLFERVAGAKVIIKGDPVSTCQISLSLDIGANKSLYKKSVSTDKQGYAELVVPYSTSHKGGRIKSDEFYKVSYYQNSRLVKASLIANEDDVLLGRDVSLNLMSLPIQETTGLE